MKRQRSLHLLLPAALLFSALACGGEISVEPYSSKPTAGETAFVTQWIRFLLGQGDGNAGRYVNDLPFSFKCGGRSSREWVRIETAKIASGNWQGDKTRTHVLNWKDDQTSLSCEMKLTEFLGLPAFQWWRGGQSFRLGQCEADLPLAGKELLNAFAYTCCFSVCAALAGAFTCSLDLSRKYLEWGKRNFAANHLDPTVQELIRGDVFDWLGRFKRRRRAFDIVLLDPPTFSPSRESGVFRAEKDYAKLVSAAVMLVRPGGVLFCSTNAAGWHADSFLAAVSQAVHQAGRKVSQRQFCRQPPDFPVSRQEPAYLKTVWLRV